jgi:hypothetical protein
MTAQHSTRGPTSGRPDRQYYITLSEASTNWWFNCVSSFYDHSSRGRSDEIVAGLVRGSNLSGQEEISQFR